MSGPARKFTPDQEAAIAVRYQAGESMDVIGRSLGCDGNTIRLTLIRLGIQRRSHRQAGKIARRIPGEPASLLNLSPAARQARRLSSYQKRIRAGKCPACVNDSLPGGRLCGDCLSLKRAKLNERRTSGTCLRCGIDKAVAGMTACDVCTARQASFRLREKVAAFNGYGGCRCICCGETELVFLTLDHIDGNGATHRRTLGMGREGGAKFYRLLRLQGYPPGYQVLCFNCNCARGQHGECPHKRSVELLSRNPRRRD